MKINLVHMGQSPLAGFSRAAALKQDKTGTERIFCNVIFKAYLHFGRNTGNSSYLNDIVSHIVFYDISFPHGILLPFDDESISL